MLNYRIAATCLLILCLPSAALGEDALDRNTVYRVNPPGQRLMAVPRAEIKPGFVYKYYNPQLAQHVWGLATQDGKFRFAFGPGSMQPAERFDHRLSASQQQQLVEEQVPGLSKGVEIIGRNVYLRLDAEDRWQLYHTTSIAKVFDRMTGQRWEWHGNRLVGVLHTTGNVWQWHDGRYYPSRSYLR